MPFQPAADLADARARSRRAVDEVLAKLAAGSLPDDVELERVDIKEEARRRGSGGTLLPGEEQNTAAAAHLADEVTAFANTPGGGALVIGVENRSGNLLGTNLDCDWLRHAIYTRVDVAPLVEARERSTACDSSWCTSHRPASRWKTPRGGSGGGWAKQRSRRPGGVVATPSGSSPLRQ